MDHWCLGRTDSRFRGAACLLVEAVHTEHLAGRLLYYLISARCKRFLRDLCPLGAQHFVQYTQGGQGTAPHLKTRVTVSYSERVQTYWLRGGGFSSAPSTSYLHRVTNQANLYKSRGNKAACQVAVGPVPLPTCPPASQQPSVPAVLGSVIQYRTLINSSNRFLLL